MRPSMFETRFGVLRYELMANQRKAVVAFCGRMSVAARSRCGFELSMSSLRQATSDHDRSITNRDCVASGSFFLSFSLVSATSHQTSCQTVPPRISWSIRRVIIACHLIPADLSQLIIVCEENCLCRIMSSFITVLLGGSESQSVRNVADS